MNKQLNLHAFKDREIVNKLAEEIQLISENMAPLKIMHICGGHENAIVRYGVRQFLPGHIQVIAGPGCPVCICPVEAIDQAVTLSLQPKVTVLTFGDMLRVPATTTSLEKVRSDGGSVKVIYSPLDAVKFANEKPEQTFVFFSVGFETTAAGIAGLIQSGVPKNLLFLIANRYMPPVLKLLMEVHDESLQGFLLAGHATAISGLGVYDFMHDEFKLPCAAAGFEPVDILLAVRELLKQIKNSQHEVINCYPRVIREEGNLVAQKCLNEVFDLKPGVWRGIDVVEDSAYILKEKYAFLDAGKQLTCIPPYPPQAHHPSCLCHRIMLGEVEPQDCKLFKKACTPGKPFGPCMVSPEGTCHVRYTYPEIKIDFS
ncbi:hydrogenase formation protein HypD [Psychromonas aquimarina]|uniref:hydrogenase formation protein HypD n=1 Tax=Psychromonas aquimarina TaxID=444919 RepID=UPI000418A447|nr:hydrogenase formation protein HypD [Psychromonas aquimarina]